MLPNKLLEEVVLEKNLIEDAKKWKDLVDEAKKRGKKIIEIILNNNLIDEYILFNGVANYLNLPFITLKDKEILPDTINLVPNILALTHNVMAFGQDNKTVKLAMVDPTDMETIEFIKRKTGLDPQIFVTAPTEMRNALRLYSSNLEEEFKIIQEKTAEAVTSGDLKKVAEELPIINIVNNIIEHAIYEEASDIHIEPSEKDVSIRYRIDGVLRPVMTLPKSLQNGVVARIKILSDLRLDEHMTPQDGRFKIQIQNDKIAFRVSIIPVYDGEKIVMRLLPEGLKSLTLDELGFLQKDKSIVEKEIKKPNGIILVTGPTGSGKTTTLYSILNMLNQPGINISTIEDPIEYRIKGINQSQINPKIGFTFAAGLRAFLRQDPNIIMVGEIRDEETADTSIHAAMTGHLVLSTLHTNDAPTTLPRLIDMNIPPFLVSYTTNMVIAQRLIRRICKYCKKEIILDKSSVTDLGQIFGIEKIMDLFKKNNILKGQNNSLDKLTFYEGEGCPKCKQTGYKGRLGIYEVMQMSNDITKKIIEHATASDIKVAAQKNGMTTMFEDGLIKAKMGLTTINEILRVTKE